MQRFAALLLRAPRRWVQAAAFLVMNSYFLQTFTKALPCLGLNCYACPVAIFACPIGTLQHFAVIRQVPLYTLGMLTVVGAAVGRLACGWLCPFGWLQELMHDLGQRLQLRHWRVPDWMSWLRYACLVCLVGVVPLLTFEPWFSKLCPVGALEAALPLALSIPALRDQFGWLFALKIVILGGFLAWMLWTRRPFCRFVCPLGAIWSPFNRVSALRLSVDKASCSHCGTCNEVCPVDIAVHEDPNSDRCVRCMECLRACPEAAIRLLGE